MLIELDRDNRKPLRKLFDDYPCCHGCIASVIQGGMGKVFTDSSQNPLVALAVFDFQFLAGDASHKDVPLLFEMLHTKEWLIAPTPAWQNVVATMYQGKVEIYQREAFKADQFDAVKLRKFISELPSGFELRKVRKDDIAKFAELSSALLGSFQSDEEFIESGVGFGIIHDGRFVSGASAPVSGGNLEFEIQTHKQFRRQGLARVVAAALILYCLENGFEPCWDAANKASSNLARQLGFHSTGKYDAFWLP